MVTFFVGVDDMSQPRAAKKLGVRREDRLACRCDVRAHPDPQVLLSFSHRVIAIVPYAIRR